FSLCARKQARQSVQGPRRTLGSLEHGADPKGSHVLVYKEVAMDPRQGIRCTLGIGIITCVIVVALATTSASGQRATLTLLTVNDVYEIAPVQGQGGLAELMTLLRAERATATHHLMTVNGDFLSPSLMSSMFKGAQMVALFNALGVDMVVFGNHEFDL